MTRLISLIKPEDYHKNLNSINSLVELFNNQFYEYILIPVLENQVQNVVVVDVFANYSLIYYGIYLFLDKLKKGETLLKPEKIKMKF